MQIGVTFPTAALGNDPAAIRDFVQAAEGAGFAHLRAAEHVIGGHPDRLRGERVHTYDVVYHEPFVLFGYLAALTSLELVTGIIILPQRQTALVAKQATEVDLLTGGKFRLGVGIGWNAVEYEALGKDFTNRGRRLEEQVQLLRRLWTEPTVTHDGEYEKVTGAGLAPMPVQRPIPIWFGARSPAAYRRAGRLGDGWFPMVAPGPKLDEARAWVEKGATEAGRDPSSLGMEGRINWSDGLDKVVELAGGWRDAGATHVSVNTMNAGLATVDDHLDALATAAGALKLSAPSR